MAEQNGQRTAADVEAELEAITNAQNEQEYEQANATDGDLDNHQSYEDAAGHKGWVPKEQFKGDSSKWVDAKTFVERGEKFNVNLQKEVAALKSKIESFEGTKAAFAKFHAETVARKDAELSEAIKALRIERSAATRNGEDELAIELDDRIDGLRAQQKEVKQIAVEPQAQTPAEDPVLLEWIEDGNDWFKEDGKLRAYAIAMAQDMNKNGETLRGRKFLDKVTERMAEEFPRKFRSMTNSAGRSGSNVEGGSTATSSRTGGYSERDLPAEDLKLMKQFVAEGWTTRDAFLKSYFSRNG